MFKSIKSNELNKNIFTMIAKEWGLITVQCEEKVNGMTVSWVQLGHLWNKDVVTVYVRPQRYTQDYIQKEEVFSLAFFDESYRKDLAYLGSASGKDEDKLKKVQMTTETWKGAPIIQQAKLIFVCKKLYQDKITKEAFLDKELMNQCYPEEDFHYRYVAEIIDILIEE